MGASRHAAQREQGDQRQRDADAGVDDEGRPRSSSHEDAGDDAPGGEVDDGRPELIDATRYDFDRLERAIGGLVAQQRALAAENEALRVRVSDRDAEVERLASELRGAVERRKHALERVDALIDELDRLDARLDDAMVDWVEPPDDSKAATAATSSPATRSSPPG